MAHLSEDIEVKNLNHDPQSASLINAAFNERPDRDVNGSLVEESAKDDEALQGLRNLLREWHSGPWVHNEQSQRLAAETSIYSTYAEAAAKDDEELSQRWAESLNIFLTFAGLQSAVTTAFIIALNPTLGSDPLDTTNQLLQQILHQMNNTTLLIPTDTNHGVPQSIVQVLAWWYTSLACSLFSASGSLLSKQWAVHYRSQTTWASTAQKQAQLRASRFHSLADWGFFGIIEGLNVSLQLSLFLFAMGFAEFVRPTSLPLYAIVATIITSGTTFYGIALISGALRPDCPFQSLFTNHFIRLGHYSILRALFAAKILVTALACAIGWITRDHGLVQKAGHSLREKWSIFASFDFAYWIRRPHRGALGAEEAHVGTAAVLWWWIQEYDRLPETKPGHHDPADINTAVDLIISLPSKIVAEYFTKTSIFPYWCRETLSNLTYDNCDNRLKTDLLCYFMHNSSVAMRIALRASPGLSGPSGFIKSLRGAWGMDGIPVSLTRWTTISVYLRQQLRVWCDPVEQFHQRDLPYLLETVGELPALLKDPRLEGSLDDVANVVSLVAIAGVDDAVPGVRPREELVLCKPLDQLFLALHRISHYRRIRSSSNLAHEPSLPLPLSKDLLTRIITAARVTLARELDASGPSILVESSTWENGELGDVLLQLLDLCLLLCNEPGPQTHPEDEALGLGIGLVQQIHAFVNVALHSFASAPEVQPEGLFALASDIGIASAFRSYAHRHPTAPQNIDSLAFLESILGLRLYILHPLSIFPYVIAPPQQYSILPQSVLRDNPQVLQRLIHDVQQAMALPDESQNNRLQLLSVILKGRDFFFPHVIASKYEDLGNELSSMGEAMIQSRNFLGWIPDIGFRRWDELLQALVELRTLLEFEMNTPGVLKSENGGDPNDIQSLSYTLAAPGTTSP